MLKASTTRDLVIIIILMVFANWLIEYHDEVIYATQKTFWHAPDFADKLREAVRTK